MRVLGCKKKPVCGKCVACKHNSETEQLKRRVTELEAQLPKWVSVDDKPPEIGQEVLIYPVKMHLGDEPVLSAHVREKGRWHYIWAGTLYDVLNVTHWMPLPQPPKEQGDD